MCATVDSVGVQHAVGFTFLCFSLPHLRTCPGGSCQSTKLSSDTSLCVFVVPCVCVVQPDQEVDKMLTQLHRVLAGRSR